MRRGEEMYRLHKTSFLFLGKEEGLVITLIPIPRNINSLSLSLSSYLEHWQEVSGSRLNADERP
jgi:hypothetical protein